MRLERSRRSFPAMMSDNDAQRMTKRSMRSLETWGLLAKTRKNEKESLKNEKEIVKNETANTEREYQDVKSIEVSCTWPVAESSFIHA
jgi:hypothetical protein